MTNMTPSDRRQSDMRQQQIDLRVREIKQKQAIDQAKFERLRANAAVTTLNFLRFSYVAGDQFWKAPPHEPLPDYSQSEANELAEYRRRYGPLK
jgi:hypothetical protein